MTLEQQIAKYTPTKYNPYFWWRRFKPRETLDSKAPFRNKVANGDFEVSDYHSQILWERKLEQDALSKASHVDAMHEIRSMYGERKRRLSADYERDQTKIDNNMFKMFKAEFRLSREQVEEKMIEFDGTLHEFCEELFLAKYTSYI